MNKLYAFAVAIIFSTAFASPALAEKMAFSADLKGPSEFPPTDSAGTGKAEVTATRLLDRGHELMRERLDDARAKAGM